LQAKSSLSKVELFTEEEIIDSKRLDLGSYPDMIELLWDIYANEFLWIAR